jgi:shikimate kinase
MVLSPGGGWIIAAETVALLRPPSRLIYLKVKPATALKRMALKRASRPLLQRPDPLAELDRLLATRHREYEAADFVVDVERLDPQGVVSQIQKKMSSAPAG